MLPTPRTPRRAARALSPLLLPLLLFMGCATAAPPEVPPPATVKWQNASENFLEEWTELVGTTLPLPDRVARVSAVVEGRVLTVLPSSSESQPLAEGQQVEKGTTLVELDSALARANLAKVEASQAAFLQEEKQAQFAVELATKDVERLRDLAKTPSNTGITLVPAIEREKADIALKDAQSKLQGSRDRAAAAAKEAEALHVQLQYYTLKAPISGRLGRLQVVQGQTLTVGTPVADVIDLDDRIDVLCFVPASMVGRFKKGQLAFAGPVDKDPNAAAQPEADGQVEYVAEQAESETGNFAVKVRFDNKSAHLRASRVLRLRVQTQPGRACLSLPESAVQEDEDPPTVVVVTDIKTVKNADGKEDTVGTARRLQVVLGVRDRLLHQVEVVSLTDPEKEADKKWQGSVHDAQFVVEGAQGVQSGDVVKLDAGDD